jgi:hypothetical protein
LNSRSLLLEATWALGVFIPVAALAAEQQKEMGNLSMVDKINLMKDVQYASKDVAAASDVVRACHMLRKWEHDMTDHDKEDDLKLDEKPDVIENVFIVAKALLSKVMTSLCPPQCENVEKPTELHSRASASASVCVSCGGCAPTCGCAWQRLRQQQAAEKAAGAAEKGKAKMLAAVPCGRNSGKYVP